MITCTSEHYQYIIVHWYGSFVKAIDYGNTRTGDLIVVGLLVEDTNTSTSKLQGARHRLDIRALGTLYKIPDKNVRR